MKVVAALALLSGASALVNSPSGSAAPGSAAQRSSRARVAAASTLEDSIGAMVNLNGWQPDSSAFAWGLPGSLEPAAAFDPWGLSEGKTLEEMKMYREAEVTHGRVAMLATVGFLAQERAHFLFVEPDKDIGPAIRHLDEVRQVSPAFFEGLGFVIACAELYRSQRGWLNPSANGLGDYPRLLSQEYYPGDIGFNPLGLKPQDADEFAEMATKELQHGRLAMLAIAGFVAQELVDGSPILDTDAWSNIL